MGNGPSWWRHAAIVSGFLVFAAGLWLLLTDGTEGAGGGWPLPAFGMVAGTGLFLGGVASNIRSDRYGEPRPVTADVTLTPAEARDGAAKTVAFTARACCGACGGDGGRGRVRCRRCWGSGLAGRERQARVVYVPAGARDRSEVTLHWMGAPGGRHHQAGDLLLSLRVEGGRAAPAAAPAAPHARSGPRTGRKPRPGSNPRPASTPPQGPVTVLSGKEDTEFAVHRSGITVQDKWPRPGGGARWKVRFDMRWEAITGLWFDYGSHDSVVSLYAAVPTDGPAPHHVVDSRTFTAGQWTRLADSVSACIGGRLTVDLTGREHPGPPRDS